ILAEGATSRDAARDRDGRAGDLSALAAAAQRSGDILGVASVDLADFPDNRMDGVDLLDVVKRVEAAVGRWRPSVVYTHHGGDVNVDHRVAHEAVITACRPQPGYPVDTLLFFEVPSSTEWRPAADGAAFRPDWFVDISDTLETKLAALRAYDAELRAWPHPRSLEGVTHLARWRGASCGLAAAEAFALGRKIS
ncbi:MAG: PIG-L family deacetylase, partial [Rhodobacterales bacterium]|nr:PIG-L family deacetylase [Rhodobacterales bacterium]